MSLPPTRYRDASWNQCSPISTRFHPINYRPRIRSVGSLPSKNNNKHTRVSYRLGVVVSDILDDLPASPSVGAKRNLDQVCVPNKESNLSNSRSTSIMTIPAA